MSLHCQTLQASLVPGAMEWSSVCRQRRRQSINLKVMGCTPDWLCSGALKCAVGKPPPGHTSAQKLLHVRLCQALSLFAIRLHQACRNNTCRLQACQQLSKGHQNQTGCATLMMKSKATQGYPQNLITFRAAPCLILCCSACVATVRRLFCAACRHPQSSSRVDKCMQGTLHKHGQGSKASVKIGSASLYKRGTLRARLQILKGFQIEEQNCRTS